MGAKADLLAATAAACAKMDTPLSACKPAFQASELQRLGVIAKADRDAIVTFSDPSQVDNPGAMNPIAARVSAANPPDPKKLPGLRDDGVAQ